MTIPSPSAVHFRDGRDAVPASVYPDMEEFYRDLGQTYRKCGARLRRRRLPLSADGRGQPDLSLRSETDPAGRATAARIPEALLHAYAGMINAAMSDIPSDMAITMHLCRGNFRSTFIASGGYEPVAEMMFNAINVHGYFMEYDSERAGGFEPLRFVPKGKQVVLGLVTSKTGTLESKDEIKRRIDEAAKFVPLDQLCLSPQCGFASSEEGNVLAEEEQWAKLRMIVEIADEVWGDRLSHPRKASTRRPGSLQTDPVCPLCGHDREKQDATHQAAVPRRPCRQPAAPEAIHEARANAPRARSRAEALKEIEDREIERVIKKQEDVGLQRSPTASSAARGGISISSGASTAPRSTSWTPASRSRRRHAERGRPGHRQARHGRAASDGRAFQVRRGAYQAHAEDHHSGAVGDLRPADA